jgi:hypothetical protein
MAGIPAGNDGFLSCFNALLIFLATVFAEAGRLHSML